jgi:hypothetical protein
MATGPARDRLGSLRGLGTAALTRLWSYAIITGVIAVGVGRIFELLAADGARLPLRIGTLTVITAIGGLCYPAIRSKLSDRA